MSSQTNLPFVLKPFLTTALLTATAFLHSAQAQEPISDRPFLDKDRVSFSAAIGGQNYLGDLLPRKYGVFGATYDFAPSLKLGAEYELTPAFRVRLNYLGTKLYGNDNSNYQKAEADESKLRKERQISMTCVVNEFTLNAIVDLFGFIQDKRESWRFDITPYVGVGIGYAFTNTKLGDTLMPYRYAHTYGEEQYYERDFKKSPITGTLVFPVTAGVLWKINGKSAAFLEASRHYTTTDYLDGISNWNSKEAKNDGYINYAIGYRYTLGTKFGR